jgi:hypothetical protein
VLLPTRGELGSPIRITRNQQQRRGMLPAAVQFLLARMAELEKTSMVETPSA